MVRTEEGELVPRPEFETAALFINCCVTDRTAMVDLNHLCNEVGLDTMTTAAVMAAGMDLDGRGVLGELGLSLPFGDGTAMAAAIEAVAYRRGRSATARRHGRRDRPPDPGADSATAAATTCCGA